MADHQNLKKQVVKGSFWVFGANLISRGISLLATLILARLLTPEDFGVIGYGFLIVNAIGLLREMGFSSALIYQKREIEKSASSALVFMFLWSLLLYLIVFLLAPFAAKFFREPRLVSLLRILTITLVINSLAGVPLALLEKEINFKFRVIPDLTNLTTYAVVTVLFAFLGFNYWSFVIGTLAGGSLQLIVAMLLKPVKIRLKPDLSLLKELFRFGKNVMSLGVLNFAIRNIDDFFVGRMLGTILMGIYQFSYRIANIPATNITNVIGKVLYPGYVKIADDENRIRNAFLDSFHYVSFITIPVTLYIILIIPDVIYLFFPHWVKAILPIQLLAYFGLLRSLGSGMGSIFLAKGKPHILIPIGITQVIVILLLIYPFVRSYGIIGACITINISQTISFFMGTYWSKKLLNFKVFQFLKIIFKTLLFSIISLLTVQLIKIMVRNYITENSYIIFLIPLSYPFVHLLFQLVLSKDIIRIVKDIRYNMKTQL